MEWHRPAKEPNPSETMNTGRASVILAPTARLSAHNVRPRISVAPARTILPIRAASLEVRSMMAVSAKKLAHATKQTPTERKNVPTNGL